MITLFDLRRRTCTLLLATSWLGATGVASDLSTAAETPRPAAKPTAGERPQNSLDNALLQDLSIPAKPKGEPPRDAKPAEMPADEDADLDALPREQIGAGEDVGQPSEDRLGTIGRRMRLAESLMGRQVTSQQTQRLQQQVIQDLERLIEELNKQSQGGQSPVAGQARGQARRQESRRQR
jgi:hypothetical protein